MFSGTAKADINADAILRRLGGSVKQAQAWLDNTIANDSTPFVPRDTGTLSASVYKNSTFGSGLLKWVTPYARKLYYGVNLNFSTDKHPKATHHWFEKAKSIYLPAWGQGVARVLCGIWRRQ